MVTALRDLQVRRDRYRNDISAFNQRFQYWLNGRATGRVVDAFFGSTSADAATVENHPDGGLSRR